MLIIINGIMQLIAWPGVKEVWKHHKTITFSANDGNIGSCTYGYTVDHIYLLLKSKEQMNKKEARTICQL